MGFTGVSGLLASPCAFRAQTLRETGTNMAVWGALYKGQARQSVQTTSPRGGGVGGCERAATCNTYVCVGDQT